MGGHVCVPRGRHELVQRELLALRRAQVVVVRLRPNPCVDLILADVFVDFL